MAVTASTPIELIQQVYAAPARSGGDRGRDRLGRPLTLAEKVLVNHLRDAEGQELERGRSYADFRPGPRRHAGRDRPDGAAAVHDRRPARGRGAHRPSTATTSSRPSRGADVDLQVALDVNSEVYDFLRTVAAKYGIGFWKPGSGIIHQVVLEHYAFPGGMMIGTDSHTPNAGGLGHDRHRRGRRGRRRRDDRLPVQRPLAQAHRRAPHRVAARLVVAEGRHPQGGRGAHRVRSGTGAIVEYFGPGADTISATGKATICNMGAEIGATCSLFAYDDNMACYLKATGREAIADAADAVAERPPADDEARRPSYFDQVIEIDLDHARAAHQRPPLPRPRPTASAPTSPRRPRRTAGRWPSRPRWSDRAPTRPTRTSPAPRPSPARPPAPGYAAKTQLLVTPGSEQVRATIERDGLLADLRGHRRRPCWPTPAGRASASGRGPTSTPAQLNTIVTSYNRNFPKRNDGNANTLAFVTSPETVVALALAGTLDFDPTTDTLTNDAGEPSAWRRRSARSCPRRASTPARAASSPRRPTAAAVSVVVDPSQRPAAAARALRRLGRPGLHRPARADEGAGQVHDGPHLGRRPVAASTAVTSRTSAATCSSARSTPSPGRPARARTSSTARPGATRRSPSTTTRPACSWCAIGDENYGEGSQPRARGDGAPVPQRQGRSSPAASPASTRPT